MTRALGYVRVSSEEQAREGVSLDAQAERITAYAKALGWELVGIVRDEGRSAANLTRPGMQGILADVARPKARAWDALVVVKLDRLTRSVRDLCTLVESFGTQRSWCLYSAHRLFRRWNAALFPASATEVGGPPEAKRYELAQIGARANTLGYLQALAWLLRGTRRAARLSRAER